MKIGTKLNLLLTLVFVSGILISGAALSSVLQQKAQDEVTSKALILIQTISSVRNYTDKHITPLLESRLQTDPVFIPETVPAYSAINVFEDLRKNDAYKNFFYKEATLNPTNLRDKADSFETNLVNQFRSEPATKELSGFRSLVEGKSFYIARPLAVTQQSCLQCHSTPAAAPKSQIEGYGTENGFGWKLNEIVAAQIISVPAGDIFNSARRSFSLVMGVLVIVFAMVAILMNLLLRRTVLQRIKKMAKIAHDVSTGDMNSDFGKPTKDEIGALAVAFNRMKSSLEIALRLLNQQNK